MTNRGTMTPDGRRISMKSSARRSRIRIAAPLIAALGLGACDDGTSPETESRVSLSVVVPTTETGSAQAQGSSASSEFVQDDGIHSLVMTRVAMVLREIELKRRNHDDCDALTDFEEDSCESFEVGPFLLELPLDGSVLEIVTTEVPPDVYDEVEFEVHKPEDDSAQDLRFLQEYPAFKGVSIRVEGTFDGQAFVFLQDLNEERELSLSPPLTVEEGLGTVNLTLEIDVSSWFTAGGGFLLDPRSALKGEFHEDLVEGNIRSSIRAFPDSDRDGGID